MTQVLIYHRSWVPRRGWKGRFRWLGQYEPKPKGGKRLGWVQEAEDRCGWWVVSSLGSLSQTVQKVGWGRAQGPCWSRLALEVMGSHGRFWSRSQRVYERHILSLKPGSEKGSRQGTFKSCSEGQADSCHGRRTRGPATAAGSSSGQWPTGHRVQEPGALVQAI